MDHEGIRQCYIIENDDEALDCIKKEIAVSKDACKAKMVLLVQDGCMSCKEQVKRYQEDIAAGRISVIDAKTKEGLEIAKKNELNATPYLLILDCNNMMIE